MSKKDIELEKMIEEYFKSKERNTKEKEEVKETVQPKVKKLGIHPLLKK